MSQDDDVAQLLRLGLTSEDAHVLANSQVNVLVLGLPRATEEVLRALTPFLRQPTHTFDGTKTLPTGPPGTLILRDLETLDGRAQDELMGWLDGPGARTRVVSMTSASLYSHVQRGVFLDTLYYRLNIVHVQGSAPAADISDT